MYIDRPTDEETRSPAEDVELPEKTIDALNQVDPFDEEVRGTHITLIFSHLCTYLVKTFDAYLLTL